MSDELLPCPRPGCEGQGHITDDCVMFIWVQCRLCCIRTGDHDSEADATADWNRRAPALALNEEAGE